MNQISEARIETHDYNNRIDVAVIINHADGRLVAQPVTMVEIGDDRIPAPTFTMDRRAAQALMDELARSGFRPKLDPGQVALLARVDVLEKQNERLRGIAFAAMELVKP